VDEGRIRGLFELAGFHLDLEERLRARVDILPSDSLNPAFRQRIAGEEILIYE
jgi:predicted nucleotidyltransferase